MTTPEVIREFVIVVDERGYLSEHWHPHTDYTLRVVAEHEAEPVAMAWTRVTFLAQYARRVYVLGGGRMADLIAQRLPDLIEQARRADAECATPDVPLPGF